MKLSQSLRVLGLSSSSSQSEIKKAFLLKAKILHPDAKSGNEEQFKELVEAYEFLKKNDKNYKNISNKPTKGFSKEQYYWSNTMYERPQYEWKEKKKYKEEGNAEAKKEEVLVVPSWMKVFFASLAILGIATTAWTLKNEKDNSYGLQISEEYFKEGEAKQKDFIHSRVLSKKKNIKF
ncbi:unnamed protein product [Blepharisma stoltei]|uniref:J domain-containing protein n=1 Tax=Blepharisma stoltei TaxID=1481888 RepID=A0AAU9ITQ6_9CILI|nr:unnamed protein product [Blepharisma stoltei]